MESSNAIKKDFDVSAFKSLLQKGHQFKLDLSNSTLVEVLEAYESFKQKHSPKFTNRAIKNLIIEVQNYLDGQVLEPLDVTDDFYALIQNYLLEGREKSVKPSTIDNYFCNIRAALSWGKLHNCPISETYNLYKVDNYEKTKVVLSPEQLSHIYYYEIDSHRKQITAMAEEMNLHRFSFTVLKKVKDQFILDCNIGQRYSDAKRLDMAAFDETKTLYKTTQQKTGNKASVYLPRYAITKKIVYEILNTYNYEAPCKGLDINNFNKNLHLLLKSIGGEFNTIIKTENKINGIIHTEEKPMWKAITSHTARRTFVSYWIKHNKSIPQIQKCTGHKDLRSLQSYTILEDND